MSHFIRASKTRVFSQARAVNPRLFDRLMSHVEVKGPGDCWPTDFFKNGDGYSCIKIGKASVRSHRVMHYLFHPEETPTVVRHICNNPACVNPAHLRGGTQKDNAEDRMFAGRGGNLKGENNGRAKLNEKQIFEIRSSMADGAQLGRAYGVSKVMISKIRRGLAWSHI